MNGVNFTDFRIIGFEESSEAYLKDRDLYSRTHWLYGQCNNKSDTEGIGYLINYSFFKNLLALENIIVLKIGNKVNHEIKPIRTEASGIEGLLFLWDSSFVVYGIMIQVSLNLDGQKLLMEYTIKIIKFIV